MGRVSGVREVEGVIVGGMGKDKKTKEMMVNT